MYELPFTTTAGEILLVAIDSHGCRLAERQCRPDGDVDAEWESLERLLARQDPVATLTLHRAG